MNDCNSIQWSSGYIGLLQWNHPWFESLSNQRITYSYHSSCSFGRLEIFIFFNIFYRVFFTSKILVKIRAKTLIAGKLLRVYSSSILSMLKTSIYFCFFYRAFLLVFFTSKNISRIAKISYNRNPVKL
jgi:hypothetical protein